MLMRKTPKERPTTISAKPTKYTKGRYFGIYMLNIAEMP